MPAIDYSKADVLSMVGLTGRLQNWIRDLVFEDIEWLGKGIAVFEGVKGEGQGE